ncbi:MAG: Gfo/Idh/MocA family oxidoreductase [Deltaproteobacteria bacterium]|nr:Gfo/Idh/MocA family oxidoreductase [Deltaproteobacteria bacterium]
MGAIVVGTGFGVLTHLRALRNAGFEVHALVGRDPAKTADRAKRSGVAHGLTSLREAMALPGVDAVTVATPPHTHCDIVLEAAAAGKHLLCEKPFARNAVEGRRMFEAAEAAGVVHLLGTEFRWSTGQALATRAIRDGLIGEPRLATHIMLVPVLADPKGEVPGWWADAEQGGGWLGAYASHIIDQMRATLGEITGVSASLALLSDRDWSAEDSYTVHFRTASGCDGVLQSTAGAWGPGVICSRFSGSLGTLWIEGDAVRVADRSGVRTLEVPEDLKTLPAQPPPADFMHTAYDHLHAAGFDLGPYTKLCEVLRDRILGRETPADPAPASFADGLAGQAVLDAIRKSSAERRWIDLE